MNSEKEKQKRWKNGERGLNLNIRPGEKIVLRDGVEITNCSLSHRANVTIFNPNFKKEEPKK